jgi:hypothetical protein
MKDDLRRSFVPSCSQVKGTRSKTAVRDADGGAEARRLRGMQTAARVPDPSSDGAAGTRSLFRRGRGHHVADGRAECRRRRGQVSGLLTAARALSVELLPSVLSRG